ncbi:MAG TPA: cytochrome ubiquinol oxidase subunit I [Bradyrhizobium sp.]
MFEGWDAEVLARAQFAFTMSFHIVFPAFSIGLASYLAVLEALWLWTGREVFINLFNYWLKIFAVAFGMGVVSGIVMAYQFGTNWAVFSDKVGSVIGPLMAYEVLTAFFLEAGFLGVMLFGLERVGHKLHFIATLMVAIGTLISAFWILSANSWMQTPAGYAVNADGQFVAADWLKVIFNPSFPYRLVHMVLAAYLTTALVVGAVGAFHLLRDQYLAGPRVMFSMAMWMATLVAPIQILAGDQHGLNTLEHQPVKIMGMEGHFQSHPDGAPLVLFGLPDQAEAKVKYAIEVPKLGSLILKHSPDAPLAGLDTVPRENWPPVPITFWSFRIMVGMGFLMVALGLFSLWTRWRGTLYETPLLHICALAMGPAGFIAVLAGWITTETGRQPFTVYGLLRTTESVSPLSAPAVGSSLLAFIIAYFIVYAAGLTYIFRLMALPPHPGEEGPSADMPAHAAGITPAAGAAVHGAAS